MKPTFLIRYVLLLIFTTSLLSFILKTDINQPEESNYNINVIGNRMVDVEGNIHRIGLKKGSTKPSVIIFIDAECPISQRYIPKLNRLYKEAEDKNVLFYGVISDKLTSCSEANIFQEEYKIEFPLLFDASGDLAQRLNPKTLPQCFVLNVNNDIIYNEIILILVVNYRGKL